MTSRNARCSFCRKSYKDVGPLVEGPEYVSICGECVELCTSIIEQEKRRRIGNTANARPTAAALRGRLGPWLDNQPAVKEDLIAAAVDHYERQAGAPQRPVLLLGPVRSSKVFLAHVLACALDVPFANVEADVLGAFVGDAVKVETLLYHVLRASDFDTEAAQRSVVYVEGIDNPAKQQALLQRLDHPTSAAGGDLQFDTKQVLFICAGEFAGIDHAIADWLAAGIAVVVGTPSPPQSESMLTGLGTWQLLLVVIAPTAAVCMDWWTRNYLRMMRRGAAGGQISPETARIQEAWIPISDHVVKGLPVLLLVGGVIAGHFAGAAAGWTIAPAAVDFGALVGRVAGALAGALLAMGLLRLYRVEEGAPWPGQGDRPYPRALAALYLLATAVLAAVCFL